MTDPGRLGRGRLRCYAAPALPLAIPIIPAFVLLPNFFGLGLAATGAMLLLSRALDMVTDPAIGLLSDRWRTPFGRRKPWIVAGAIAAAAGLLRLFDPPEAVGPLYFLLWSAMLYLGWSMISIPYTAWGAELSDDYHERTRIAGTREGLGVVSILAAGIVRPATAAIGWTERAGLAATVWTAIGLGKPYGCADLRTGTGIRARRHGIARRVAARHRRYFRRRSRRSPARRLDRQRAVERFVGGAGASSSSRPPGCSGMPGAANGRQPLSIDTETRKR